MTAKATWVLLLAALVAATGASALGPTTARAAGAAIVESPQVLQSRVESYLSGQDGTFGVAAVNLDDGRTVLINADSSFQAASMYKLLVMYRVFQAIDLGDLSMDDTVTIRGADVIQVDSVGLSPGDTLTVADALNDMIAVSSNSAAFALVRRVGGWYAVTSAAEELGMRSTSLDGGFWESTPQDMAHFFQLLADRSLVSPEASNQMIDLLLQQQVNDRIPALLPGGVEVAHKTGELDDARNDGGIVRGPGGRYVLVMMAQWGDPDQEIQAEAEVSQAIYAEYGQ